MHNFRKLDIWKDSMDLAVAIYRLTSNFPDSERFNLTHQIRKASVSVPSNIAEGAGRNTNRDFNNFLGIATGSSYELETQLILSERLGFTNEQELLEVIPGLHSIQKRIYNFKKRLE